MVVISVILLSVHLLAMNVASAGPLVCVWLHGRRRRGDDAAFRAGRELAWASLGGLAVGVASGVMLLGLAWAGANPAYFDALERFPTRALQDAGVEILFSLACLSVYVATWDRWRMWPRRHAVWALLSTTNLLYHFPPLMFVLGELAVRPELVPELVITRDVFRPLMVRPDVLSQSVHFALASVAIAGFALIVVARRQCRVGWAETHAGVREQHPMPGVNLVSAGARIALGASLMQLLVGVWVLVELPVHTRNWLTGGDALATSLFVLAILATLAVLQTLAAVAQGESSDAAVRRCGLLLLTIVVLMTGTLLTSRSAGQRKLGRIGRPTAADPLLVEQEGPRPTDDRRQI